MKSNSKGITLIALVITIIVLLILAGITIATLTGDNGIIGKATSAKNETNKANVKEQLGLAVTNSFSKGKLDKDILLENIGNIEGAEVSSAEFPIKVNLNSIEAQIDEDGNITIIGESHEDDEYKGKYTIANIEQLEKFRTEVNNGTFSGANNDNTAYLTKDLDLSTIENWEPIGISEEKQFNGTFIGNNHKIKNLKINGDSRFQGLFGFNGGTINGIIIESGTINNTKKMVGAICGQNNGNIINCINKANIFVELDGDTSCVGGISGYNTANAVIENCRNTGYIYGKGKLVGGICGYSFGEIKKCYNSGEIKSDSEQVAGIAGDSEGTSSKQALVESCYNIGVIYGSDSVGGIVGCNFYYSTIKNCYNIGGISYTSGYGGAIIGSNWQNATNCYYLASTCDRGIGTGSTAEVNSKTETELKNAGLLNNNTNVWKSDTDSLNYGFPVLEGQNEKVAKNNTADKMPKMLGVNSYFDSNDYTSGNEWKNKAGVNNLIINGSANKESDGSVSLQGTSESYGSVKVGKTYNRTMYLIAKCQNYYNDYLGMFTSGITYDQSYYSLDIFSYQGKMYASSIWGDVQCDISSMQYNVAAIVSNLENSEYSFYINGKLIGTAKAQWGYRNDMMYLNTQYRGGFGFYDSRVNYKFLAVSTLKQSEEDVLENSRWLMNKYNIK